MLKPPFHFRKFFYCFLAFALGIVVANKLYSGHVATIITIVLTFCALATGFFLFGRWKGFLFILAFFFLGNGTLAIANAVYNKENYVGENIVVGRVNYVSTYNTYVYLDSVTIGGQRASNICANIENINLAIGDKIIFTSTISRIELFDEEGEFAHKFIRDGIKFRAEITDNYEIVQSGATTHSEDLRLKAKDLLEEYMSPENAGICLAMLFGDRDYLDHYTRDIYSLAGISHILVVSGLHIGFLVAMIFAILRIFKIGRKTGSLIVLIILILYNILCGFSPSVVRASIMAAVLMLSKIWGGQYDALSSLGLAGLITLCIQPFFVYDYGFLMSYGCVGSIILLHPICSKILNKFLPGKTGDFISLSLCATAGFLPFLAMFADKINLLFAFANLIIVPVFSIMFPVLFIVMLFCIVIPFWSPLLLPFSYIIDGFTYVATFFVGTSCYLALAPSSLATKICYFSGIVNLSHINMSKSWNKFFTFCILAIMLIVTILI